MPRIPQYESRLNISPRKVSAQAPAVRTPADGLTAPSRALGELGKTIGKISESIYRTQAQSQLSKANIRLLEGTNGIIAQASQDTSSERFIERHSQSLLELKNEALKEISNPLARKEFELSFAKNKINADYKLKTAYHKLVTDEALVNFGKELSLLEQEYYTSDGKRKARIIQDAQNRFDALALADKEGREFGVLSKRKARESFIAWRDGLIEGQVEWFIAQDNASRENDSEVLKAIKNPPQNSVFSQLSREQRIDLAKKSQARIFQNNQTLKREADIKKNITLDALAQKMIDGTMTYDFLDELEKVPREAGGINKEKIRRYRDQYTKLLRVDIAEKAGKKVYNLAADLDEYMDDKRTKEEALEVLFKMYADGVLDRKEAEVLAKLRSFTTDIIREKKQKTAGIATRWIYGWLSRNTDSEEEAFENFKHYLNNLSTDDLSDENISQAAQETKKKTITGKHPELLNSENPIEDNYKLEAQRLLQERGYPLDERNISALAEQLKREEQDKK